MARHSTTILLAGTLLALTSCGLEPFDLQRSQEIPPGPGVFTGSKGAFVLSPPSRDKSPPAEGERTTASSKDAAPAGRR